MLCEKCPPSVSFSEKFSRQYGVFDCEKFLDASFSLSRRQVIFGFEWNRCPDLKKGMQKSYFRDLELVFITTSIQPVVFD